MSQRPRRDGRRWANVGPFPNRRERYRRAILAIEQEARATLRAELAAKVEALPAGDLNWRAKVLDLIRGDSA